MTSGKLMVGFAVSWWLGWFDIAVSGGGAVRGCGSKRGKRGRRYYIYIYIYIYIILLCSLYYFIVLKVKIKSLMLGVL